jgi:hypothetical protein
MSEFTEKRALKVVRSVRLIPSNKVGQYFDLTAVGASFVARIDARNNVASRTRTIKESKIVKPSPSEDKEEASIKQQANEVRSGVGRIRLAGAVDYAEVTLFVLSPESEQEKRDRLQKHNARMKGERDPQDKSERNSSR